MLWGRIYAGYEHLFGRLWERYGATVATLRSAGFRCWAFPIKSISGTYHTPPSYRTCFGIHQGLGEPIREADCKSASIFCCAVCRAFRLNSGWPSSNRLLSAWQRMQRSGHSFRTALIAQHHIDNTCRPSLINRLLLRLPPAPRIFAHRAAAAQCAGGVGLN